MYGTSWLCATCIAGAAVNAEDDLFLTFMLSITLALVGAGVVFLVRVGIIQASFEKLLQEDDYTKLKKRNRPVTATVAIVYWLAVTAIFLVYIFTVRKNIHTTEISYNNSWIIWAVAGVLYPAVAAVTKALVSKKA